MGIFELLYVLKNKEVTNVQDDRAKDTALYPTSKTAIYASIKVTIRIGTLQLSCVLQIICIKRNRSWAIKLGEQKYCTC